MERRRSDGLTMLLLGCAAFLVVGTLWASASARAVSDFRPTYFGARTILSHGDPYNPADMLRAYEAEGRAQPNESHGDLLLETYNEYLPSELPFTIPFGLLPYRVAQAIWVAIIAASFLLASFLVWKEAADYAPVLAGTLLCFLVPNSTSLMAFANPSAVAVSLCVVAVWCFLRERFIAAGVMCFATALCIKPHTVGLVWLYFLLAGGVYRRRARQTLAVVAAISVPAAAWVTYISPHWVQELHSNLLAFTGPGGMNDPGPGTAGGRGIQMITDLQSVFSFYWNNPRFYNLASYAVCAPLLILFVATALRSQASRTRAWFALAAIAPLSMLPIYHRQYDAKLILLTLPACCILWAEGGRMGRWALGVTAVAFVLNGDFTWLLLNHFLVPNHNATIVPYFDLLAFPVPLSLLAVGGYYLWAYMRRAREIREGFE